MISDMTDEEYDKQIRRAYRIMFSNDDSNFYKVLWRMSCGYMMEAYHIMKTTLSHYVIEVDLCFFDNVCALANDGVEVEWLDIGWKPCDESSSWQLRSRQQKIDEIQAIDDKFAQKQVRRSL